MVYIVLNTLLVIYVSGAIVSAVLTVYQYIREEKYENGKVEYDDLKSAEFQLFILFCAFLSWYWVWLLMPTIRENKKIKLEDEHNCNIQGLSDKEPCKDKVREEHDV